LPPDRGEKTEPPTPRRRQEAREHGQVARSQDLPAAVMLLGTVLAFKVLGPSMLHDLIIACRRIFSATIYRPQDVVELAGPAIQGLAAVAVPLLSIAAALAVLGNIVQVGWLVSWWPLKPDLNRLNPISGLARLFDLQALVRLLMSMAKMALVCAVAVLTILQFEDDILYTARLGVWPLAARSGHIAFVLAVRMAGVLLVLALIDYGWQKWRFEQELRMTREEVKEELRRLEGDPVVKQRRRQVQMQLAMQRMRYEVPKADVVVTNPTEIAVAIRYDPETMNAPKVVAKGQGFMAEMIRKIALEHGVPIVERKPLAQALYRAVEVGQEIPPQFYRAIAEVLAYVYEITGRRLRRQSARL